MNTGNSENSGEKFLPTEPECTPDSIRHDGIIRNIDNKYYYVSIIARSACASCHARGICNISEIQEEIIEVPRKENKNYKTGDKVEVLMEKTSGAKAVMLGYVIPFIILLITLIVSLSLFKNEGVAGLISIGILIPYYLFLYFIKDRLKKTFVFKIKKHGFMN